MDARLTLSRELTAWREVHQALTKALCAAHEAVAIQKAQRRFWLEEICANLDDEGRLVATSVWRRPGGSAKRVSVKRSSSKQVAISLAVTTVGAKRKRKEKNSNGGPRKTEKKASNKNNEVISLKKEEILDDEQNSETDNVIDDQARSPATNDYDEDTEMNEEEAEEVSGGNVDYPATSDGYNPLLTEDDDMRFPHSVAGVSVSGVPHLGLPWLQSSTPNLQLMAAATFGSNPTGYMPNQQYQLYPEQQYVPQGQRTYTSLQDVEPSDDDEDDGLF